MAIPLLHEIITDWRVQRLRSQKPALFLSDRCYLSRPMSRLAQMLFAMLVLTAIHLPAQVTTLVAPAPAAAAPVPAAAAPVPAPDPNALKWDAETKESNAKPGETSAAFTFVVTNVS